MSARLDPTWKVLASPSTPAVDRCVDIFVRPDGTFGFEENAPCIVHEFYAPIFRIAGQNPTDLFCVSGLTNPLNEFKGVYEAFGFSGLKFTEIWRSEREP